MNYPDQQDSLARDMGIDHLFRYGKQAAIFAQVLNIVSPRSILEIGFFKGHSAFMWLAQSSASLISVDPMKCLYDENTPHEGDKTAPQRLQDLYGPRFSFIEKASRDVCDDLKGKRFNLLFMDGGHWVDDVRNDFQLALDLGIDWILADDFITDVKAVYEAEFKHRYFIVSTFNREDLHEGQPIPMVLLRRIEPSNWRMIR